MAAIIGLDDNKVESACHRIDDDVWVANITDATTYSTAFADDAFGFVGNGAVEVNVSGFAQATGQTWRLIQSGGETTQGPIANGFVTTRSAPAARFFSTSFAYTRVVLRAAW